MSTKRESKQPAPSVMSRLMGLDEMPTQQPVQKKQRVLSENYLRRVASIGVREKWSERHSFNSSIKKQGGNNSVFQALETLRKNKHQSMPIQKREVNLVSSEIKMKVPEAKCDLWNKKLPSSKEFVSKTDNILKYLQKPDLCFTKEINKPNDENLSLHSGPFAVPKSLCSSECGDVSMCRKFRRKSEQGYVNSLNKVQSSIGIYYSGEVFHDNVKKFSRSKFKPNNISYLPTTKMDVLKPNLGNADSAARSFSIPSQSHEVSHPGNGNQNRNRNPRNGNLFVEVKKSKNLGNGMEPVRPRSRFLRERTRTVGHGICSTPIEGPSTETSGSDSFVKASESTIPSSPILSDRKRLYHISDGPNAAMDVEDQIFERRKMSKRFQQVELSSRSTISGAMHSIPEKPGDSGLSKQGGPDSRDANFGNPLGISSWDGCSNECIRELPTSRSLLSCFNAVENANAWTRHEHLENGWSMRDLKSIDLEQNKPKEQDFDLKDDGSECRSSDSSYKKSRDSLCLESENNSPVGDNYAVQSELENKLKEKDSGGQISAVAKSSSQINQTLQDVWMKQDEDNNEGCEEDLLGHQLESRNFILSTREEDSSCHIGDTSLQQELSHQFFEEESFSSLLSGTDPESLMSFEEAYQPSPNSVLEPFYNKEISSISDCFKSVNASLHGLHMQLELLKSEISNEYSEGSSMMVSCNEDDWEGSIHDSEENECLMITFGFEGIRNFSYLVDVLTEEGFHDRDLRAGFDTGPFQVSYSVFENLEKKYGEQNSWKRSERRLLFDRINSELMEILQPSTGVLTWTKPLVRRLNFSLRHDMIEEELWTLLVSQEKEASKGSEKFSIKDDERLELGDDIQVIGREIENYLFDELLADVVMESSC